MQERGIVTEVFTPKDEKKEVISIAKVEVDLQGGCQHCNYFMRGICSLNERGKIELDANNNIHAQVGDKVIVERREGIVLKVAFLVYLFPILMFLAGSFLAQGLGMLEQWSWLIGLIFLFLAFLVVRVFDKKMKKKMAINPIITKIIKS